MAQPLHYYRCPVCDSIGVPVGGSLYFCNNCGSTFSPDGSYVEEEGEEGGW